MNENTKELLSTILFSLILSDTEQEYTNTRQKILKIMQTNSRKEMVVDRFIERYRRLQAFMAQRGYYQLFRGVPPPETSSTITSSNIVYPVEEESYLLAREVVSTMFDDLYNDESRLDAPIIDEDWVLSLLNEEEITEWCIELLEYGDDKGKPLLESLNNNNRNELLRLLLEVANQIGSPNDTTTSLSISLLANKFTKFKNAPLDNLNTPFEYFAAFLLTKVPDIFSAQSKRVKDTLTLVEEIYSNEPNVEETLREVKKSLEDVQESIFLTVEDRTLLGNLLDNVEAGLRQFSSPTTATKGLGGGNEKAVSSTVGSTKKTVGGSGDGNVPGEKDYSSDCEPIESNISFNNLTGALREKELMTLTFIVPTVFPSLFKPARAVLLYGPPGTGKSFLVRATIGELKSRLPMRRVEFFNADGATLKGGFLGETEKRIKGIFECAAKRAGRDFVDSEGKQGLSVVFMDEVDAVGGRRGGLDTGNMTTSVNALLSVVSGVDDGRFTDVKWLAATNRPWSLDTAILRRFDLSVFVDLPNDETRAQLMSDLLQQYFVSGNPFLQKEQRKDQLIDFITYRPRVQLSVDDQGVARVSWFDQDSSTSSSSLFPRWDTVIKSNYQQAGSPAEKNPLQVDDLVRLVRWTGIMNGKIYEKFRQHATKTGKIDWSSVKVSASGTTMNNDDPPSVQSTRVGYSNSDIDRLTKRALQRAGQRYLTEVKFGNPNDSDVCRGQVFRERAPATSSSSSSSSSSSNSEKFRLWSLPTNSQSTEQQTLDMAVKVVKLSDEQAKCVRLPYVTMDDFIAAIADVPPTVETEEYVDLVNYSETGKVPQEETN